MTTISVKIRVPDRLLADVAERLRITRAAAVLAIEEAWLLEIENMHPVIEEDGSIGFEAGPGEASVAKADP